MSIQLKYRPRPWFTRFHLRALRWAILVMHRRAGKTVAVVNDILEKASYNTRPNPRYGYVAPLYNQAKQIAWQYLKDFSDPFRPKISESGLFVELPHNKARITLYGADNPDAFRGLYFDGVALDEWGNMTYSIFPQILLPALSDRKGWAVFMGTPNGPNHFRDDYYRALREPERTFAQLSTVEDTHALPPEEVEELRRIMDPDIFAQEMMCSFTASTRGAFYAREFEAAHNEKRIVPLTADEEPLHFVLDLGFRDDTAIIAWQDRPDGYAILRSTDDNTRPIPYYIEKINEICLKIGAPRGKVWLPHDARAKSLQTGRSIVEQFVSAGIRPAIVPQMDLLDGIAAARMVFPLCWFDKDNTEPLQRALQSYRREFDEDKKAFRNVPVHDWASHYADAFRYFALVAREVRPPSAIITPQQSLASAHNGVYAFNLDQLWSTITPQRSRLR